MRRGGGVPASRIAPSGSLILGAAEQMPDGAERIALYLAASQELNAVAVTFGLGDRRSPLRFAAAPGLIPSLVEDGQTGVVAAAWLNGVSVRRGERLLLGYVSGPSGSLANLEFYGASATNLNDYSEVRLDLAGGGGR